MVRKAASYLEGAVSHAEVLDAKRMAQAVFTTAKAQARMAKAKEAHSEVIRAIRSTQAQALEIEAKANERLADEFDAAQERGEVATGRDGPGAGVSGGNAKATVADLGLTRKDIHEARQVRDAEKVSPGIVKRTLEAIVERGEDPTRTAVRAAVQSVLPKAEVRPEPAPASNVVQLAPRQPTLPSYAEIETEGEAQEAADDVRDGPEIDLESLEGRAHAFNGALSTLDLIALSGREYWSVFRKDPAKIVYEAWVRSALAKLTDIVKELDDAKQPVGERGRKSKAVPRSRG